MYTKTQKKCTLFSKLSRNKYLSMCAAIILLCLYKSGYFLFKIMKEASKHISCDMFSKFSGDLNKPIKSDQNVHQNAPN